MSQRDNKDRIAEGVVASLSDLGDGNSSLIFDDVRLDHGSETPCWLFERPFTSKKYENDVLDGLTLTSADYQTIGENLVVRLLALNGRIK